MNIAIINYSAGNTASVLRAFLRAGVGGVITDDPSDVKKADAIVLPGVGAYAAAMKKLEETGLLDTLHQAALIEKKPILGICLGMQLMAEASEEKEKHAGLGWIGGQVQRMDKICKNVAHLACDYI